MCIVPGRGHKYIPIDKYNAVHIITPKHSKLPKNTPKYPKHQNTMKLRNKIYRFISLVNFLVFFSSRIYDICLLYSYFYCPVQER